MSTLELDFVGEPFDALALTDAAPPTPAAVASSAPSVAPSAGPSDALPAALRELRGATALAHEQVLRAYDALHRRALRRPGAAPPGTEPAPAAPSSLTGPAPLPPLGDARFKPLARTPVTHLDGTALAALAAGDIVGVFGPEYRQDGANPDIRTSGGRLASVTGLALHGGTYGRGRLTARTAPTVDATDPAGREAVVASVVQAAEVYALYLGLHLCHADATLVRDAPGLPAEPLRADLGPFPAPDGGSPELVVDVTAVDLVPRPHLRVTAEVRVDGTVVGRVSGVTVAVCEKPGVPVGPERGGRPARWLGRLGRSGERAMLGEFHLAQLCRGDHGVAFGPEFAHYSHVRSTRPPDGGLLLVDRIMESTGERGDLSQGAHRTEYDSPSDSWYYADTANASMPNCVYMETSLQAALLLGYYLGPTLSDPGAAVSLRNLGGTATVLREVDLRDRTVVQHSELLSTSPMPGATLQTFAYTASVDGEPFYSGETLFGYFSDAAMANQTGLDAGRPVPTWWDAQQPRPAVRTVDVAARRADPTARLVSRGQLALLDEVQVVDGGGEYGLGYLRAVQPIDPEHWVFARHFRYDPVIPGSFGVEAVVHALQEWLLDSGHGDDLPDAGFVLPVGAPFTWKYRGQFLPTDGEYLLEVHIKSVEHRPGRVRVTGDASMWKPGLRIYELTDVAVELRTEGAQPW